MKSKYAVLDLKYDDILYHKYLPYVMVWESDTLVPYLTYGLSVHKGNAGIDTDKEELLYVAPHNFSLRKFRTAFLKVPKNYRKRLMCRVKKIMKRETLFK